MPPAQMIRAQSLKAIPKMNHRLCPNTKIARKPAETPAGLEVVSRERNWATCPINCGTTTTRPNTTAPNITSTPTRAAASSSGSTSCGRIACFLSRSTKIRIQNDMAAPMILGTCIWGAPIRKPCTPHAQVVAAVICHSRMDTPRLLLARTMRRSWGMPADRPMAAATHPKTSVTPPA